MGCLVRHNYNLQLSRICKIGHWSSNFKRRGQSRRKRLMKLFRRRLRPESRPSFTTHCREVVFLFAKKHPEGIPLSTSLQLVNGVAAATLKFRSKNISKKLRSVLEIFPLANLSAAFLFDYCISFYLSVLSVSIRLFYVILLVWFICFYSSVLSVSIRLFY